MRYLVRAKLKQGHEEALLKAIDSQTLGQGSIAGDEYFRNMQEARLYPDQTARWVEVCYCPSPLQEEKPYWRGVFRLNQSSRRPRPAQVPRRKRQRIMGLRRL